MDVKKIGLAVVPFVLLISMTIFVQGQAVPDSIDTIDIGGSGRYTGRTDGYVIPAFAGNVTELTITDQRSTRFWQGYFGDVTGTIVLDDANNNTFFAWNLINPQGEVYAVNTSTVPSWQNVTCVNLTSGAAVSDDVRINLDGVNEQYGMEGAYLDSFNYTFNQTLGVDVIIGPRTVTGAQGCSEAYSFVDGSWQNSVFRETLVHDNDSALIFVAILEINQDGFRSGVDNHDFQMLVAENGAPGGPDITTTTYYFYVELE